VSPPDEAFPIGAGVTLEQLTGDPHPVHARLREREPVSWLPALGGWLVTRRDLALAVMRDPATYTVDDPRFSTAQVIGPSMLSLDGPEHARHRTPFAAPFRARAVRERFERATADEANRLIDHVAPNGHAELRRAFAGPLAASIMARALGLHQAELGQMLDWYDGIVAGVTELTAGQPLPARGRDAFAALRARLHATIAEDGKRASLLGAAAAHSDLTDEQIVSNAAVLLFGGIETTEGMISNAILHLLERPELAREPEPGLDAAIEESIRLAPAAAVIDRYATTDVNLDAAHIRRGDLVRVSISAANRDPAIFHDPDEYAPGRPRPRSHLAFAQGPHVCLGIHLARLEARIGVAALLSKLPALRLDPERPARIQGLVFRKPPTLYAVWEAS
jgi:cytochrome P450